MQITGFVAEDWNSMTEAINRSLLENEHDTAIVYSHKIKYNTIGKMQM